MCVCRVEERRGDSVVEPEKGGMVRVLSRNHLFPIGEKMKKLNDGEEAVKSGQAAQETQKK